MLRVLRTLNRNWNVKCSQICWNCDGSNKNLIIFKKSIWNLIYLNSVLLWNCRLFIKQVHDNSLEIRCRWCELRLREWHENLPVKWRLYIYS